MPAKLPEVTAGKQRFSREWSSLSVKKRSPKDQLVKIYEAPTIAETMVLRGLLKSAGIYAPDFDTVDPFPLHDPPEGWHSSEIWVPASQAEEARRIIAGARMKH